MKQKCKRLTALVLALAMCLSLLSATAWAADLSAEDELVAEEVQEDPEPAEDEAAAEEEAAESEETPAEEAEEDTPAEEAEEETPAEEAEEEPPAEEAEEETPAEEVPAEETEEETPAEEIEEEAAEAEEQEAAVDEGDITVSASSTATETYTTTYINPLYADVITEDDLVQPSEDEGDVTVSAASTTSVTSVEAAAEYLREEMKNRSKTITVYYDCNSILDSSVMTEVFELALEHTGDPEEGDYLAYQYAGMNSELVTYVYTEEITSGGVTEVTIIGYSNVITYTMTYYTDAEQEAEVTEKVAEVLDELGVDGMSDYDKIEAIYDYICTHVVYDYEDLSNSDEVLEYTAYSALINGTAVCQGYAVLFYRMALEAAVDARIVSGTGINSEGTTKAHAWDIVKLGSCYYNVDTTWDESSYLAGIDYRYFLLSEASFSTNHFRGDEYTTDEFYAAYPMASCDYTKSIDLSTCTVTVASATYTGEALTPPVTVKNPAGSTLLPDTDYTVSYEGDLVNIGSYTITIIGQGNYTGAITETFTITKADMTVKATNYTGSYDGSAHTFTLTVSGPSSYTVYYSTSTELTSSNYSTSGTTTKPTRTDVGQTVVYYYIVDSTGNCNDASGTVYIFVKPKVTVTAYSGAYNGSSHSATITVKGDATLYYSTSTKLTYSNYTTSGTTTKPTRTNAGTTTVYYIAVPTSGTINANTVTTGSTTITINKLSMTVTATGYSGTYDGSSHTVTLKVSGPSSYKVYYSTSWLTSSNYSTSGTTTKPTRTNAGRTVVYYYIKESTGNYNDVSGNLYIYIKPKVTVTAYAGVYDGSSHAATVTAAGSAKLYYSTSTKLTYSNYKSRGTTTKPTRRSVGTTTVYYIAVPTSGTVNSSDVTTGSTTITILDRLSTPTLSSLTNSSSGVTVKWKKVAGASGYYIYRNGSKLKTITSGSTVSYTDTGAKNGTKYQYKIYAYSGSTKSYASSTKTIYYVSAVSISSLKNSSTKTMTVKWGKNSKATGYQIQYSTSSGFSNSKTVTVSGASKVSKGISSLTKYKTYYVRVRAYKTVSGTKYYSAWSSTKSVKISK